MAVDDKDTAPAATGSIRFEVKPASKLAETPAHSPPVTIYGCSWYLRVRGDHNKSLRLALNMKSANESSLWSMHVDTQLTVLNENNKSSILKKLCAVYTRDEVGWGISDIITLEKLFDQGNGFTKDDAFVVCAEIRVSKVQGFRPETRFDFTDAACSLFDVTLLVEGSNVYACKQVLAAFSPFFHKLFFKDHKDEHEAAFELKDVKKEEFIDLLHVIYTLGKKITAKNVESLLKLADEFQITSVLDRCETFLKVEPNELSMIEKFKLADKYRLADLQGHCLQSFTKVKEITDLQDACKTLSPTAKSDLLFKLMKIANTPNH